MPSCLPNCSIIINQNCFKFKVIEIKQKEYMAKFKSLKEMSLLGKRYSNCNFENTTLDNADSSFVIAFNMTV